jgi:hypothetical protein
MTPVVELRGPALLATAVNEILAHPETWDQRHWHCNTKHCVFGHCQILAGRPVNESIIFSEVQELLDISHGDASWLSSGDRTLPEIYCFTKALREGPGEDGYNRAGYDRDGYNRAGYDRAGYDRDGYDRDGYDRDGYNRAGYDRAGSRLVMEPFVIPA